MKISDQDATTHSTDLDSWEQFLEQVSALRAESQRSREEHTKSVNPELLFRGQPDSAYGLKTTLERYTSSEETSFLKYNSVISRAKPQIETFTGNTWLLPNLSTFLEKVKKYDSCFPSIIANTWELSGYSYLIYLRHHGFPSPLLDWSRSEYVAAYFAFRSSQAPKTGKVSIYVYCECLGFGKLSSSDKPRIFTLGPYVKSHQRHFLQQGEYTICAQFINGEWCFEPHEKVLSLRNSEQDVCWKFTIPWSEREKVLRLLDSYTLNAYSLFNSEESLMETLAFREINSK